MFVKTIDAVDGWLVVFLFQTASKATDKDNFVRLKQIKLEVIVVSLLLVRAMLNKLGGNQRCLGRGIITKTKYANQTRSRRHKQCST